MKKHYKSILFICLLFLFSLTVKAKEMTIDEIGASAQKIQAGTSYIYVIGEYAFTSEHNLTTQDVMLASRSINVKASDGSVKNDPIYNKMSINKIEGQYDSKFNLTGWKVVDAVLGENQLNGKNKINIRYIDYNIIAEDTPINVDIKKADNEEFQNLFQTKWSYQGGNKEHSENLSLDSKGNVTGLIYKYDDMSDSVFNNTQKTGYYLGFVVEVPNLTDNTTITIENSQYSYKPTPADFINKEANKTPSLLVVFPLSIEDKIIKITVDLDGSKNAYNPTTYNLNYSNLKYQTVSQANIDDTIPNNDILTLKDWGYIEPTGDNKHFTFVNEPNTNNYKLAGKIELQHTLENVFDPKGEDGYYFAFNIQKPDNIQTVPDSAKVTITGQTTKILDKSYFDASGTLTVLFKLNDKCQTTNCQFTVSIDWDGNDKKEYLPVNYTINYEKVIFVENSLFTIEDISNNNDLKNNFSSEYGWTAPANYNVTFNSDTNSIVHLGGLVPILEKFNNKTPFAPPHDTSYYIAFSLKTVHNKQAKTTVNIINADESENKTLTETDFNKDNEIYLLKHLHPTDSQKSFDIIVDIDGSEEKYSPYKITIDWSNLKFQGISGQLKTTIAKEAATRGEEGYTSNEFKQQLTSWNYKWALTNVNLTPNNVSSQPQNYDMTGNVKEQTLTTSDFSSPKGYYVPIKISAPVLDDSYSVEDKIKIAKSWYVILKDENDADKIYQPTSQDYANGFFTMLVKIFPNGSTINNAKNKKEIYYQIDYDGKENNYIPTTQIIDYSKVQFQEIKTVKYLKDKNIEEALTTQEVYKGEHATKPEALPSKDYHTLKYWAKQDSANVEYQFATETVEEDITLIPHWTINNDKYLDTYLPTLNNDNFTISRSGNTITVNVLKANISVDELVNNNLAQTLKTILSKQEIQDISVNSTKFTSSTSEEEIKNSFKSLFTNVLTSNKNKTIDKLALTTQTFNLTIGNLDTSVELENSSPYIIKFETSSVAVDSEEELTSALTKNTIKNIYINSDFDIQTTKEINYAVTITKSESAKDITLTAQNNIDSIFNINNSFVTISNINLTGSKKAIVVNSNSSLTTNQLTLTNISEVGILVNSNASVTATNLTYDDEEYNKPAIKASKSKANVNLTTTENNQASSTIYEEIKKYEDRQDDSKQDGDLKQEVANYNFTHYYLHEKFVNKWVKLLYVPNRAITNYPLTFTRYYDKTSSDAVPEPPSNIVGLTTYSNSQADYKISSWCIGSKCEETGKLSKPTVDTMYTAVLSITFKETTVEVEDEEKLRQALNDNKKVLIVTKDIKLTSTLEITKDGVILTAVKSGEKNRNGKIYGQIIVNANNVLFDKIDIVGSTTTPSDRNDVVTINGKNFRSDQVNYSAETLQNSKQWNSVLHYTVKDPTTILYHNDFDGNNLVSFIDFEEEVDGDIIDSGETIDKTTIAGNDFYGSATTKTFINIPTIANSSTLGLTQTTYESAADDAYIIKINAMPKGSNAKLYISTPTVSSGAKLFKIGVNLSEDNKDASGITIEKYSETQQIAVYYLEAAKEPTQTNENGQVTITSRK